jgi:hypothetical protein
MACSSNYHADNSFIQRQNQWPSVQRKSSVTGAGITIDLKSVNSHGFLCDSLLYTPCPKYMLNYVEEPQSSSRSQSFLNFIRYHMPIKSLAETVFLRQFLQVWSVKFLWQQCIWGNTKFWALSIIRYCKQCDVSETGSVSVLRWKSGRHSIESIRKIFFSQISLHWPVKKI